MLNIIFHGEFRWYSHKNMVYKFELSWKKFSLAVDLISILIIKLPFHVLIALEFEDT